MQHNLENFLEEFEPKLNQYYNYLNDVQKLLNLRHQHYQNKTIVGHLGIESTFITELSDEFNDEKNFLKMEYKNNENYLVYGYYTEDYYYDSHEITYYKTYIPLKSYEILKAFDCVKFDDLNQKLKEKEQELHKLKCSTHLSKEIKEAFFMNSPLLKEIDKLITQNIEDNKVNSKLLGLAIQTYKLKNNKKNYDDMVAKQNIKTQIDRYIKRLKKIFDKKYALRCNKAKKIAFEKIQKDVDKITVELEKTKKQIEEIFVKARGI